MTDSRSAFESLTAIRAEPKSPESLWKFTELLRDLTQADAVVFADYPGKALGAYAAPSQAIAENLVSSASSVLDSAKRTEPLLQKFNFRERQVHLLAVPLERIGAKTWLLFWLRGEFAEVEPRLALAQICSQFYPGNPASDDVGFLPVIQSLTAPRYETRLLDFSKEACKFLRCERFLIVKKSSFGWQIIASNAGLPDVRSPLSHTAVLAAQACAGEEKPLVFPFAQGVEDPTDGALGELVRLLESRLVVAIPSKNWCFIAGSNDPKLRIEERSEQFADWITPLKPLLDRSPVLAAD